MGTAAAATSRTATSPGFYDVGVSTRTFDAPLFGADQSTTYRFLGSQLFPDAGNYHAWVTGGFPDYNSSFGIEGKDIPAGDLRLGGNAGDYLLRSLQPERLSRRLGDSYPLQGLRLTAAGKRSTWSVFGGSSRFAMLLPGRQNVRPSLYGAESLVRWRKNSFGAGFTVVDDPVFADAARDGGVQTVVSGRYFREFTPWASLFSEILGTRGGEMGYRVGMHVQSQRGDLSSAVYSFGEGFPYVFPLFRPGEDGLEVSAHFEPTEFSNIYGSFFYAEDDAVLNQSEIRGNVGFGLGFGSNRPHFNLDYSRNDVVYDTLTSGETSVLGDRLAVMMSQYTAFGYLGVTLDHTRSTQGVDLDRTQLLTVYRTAVGFDSYLDGSFVAQRDEADNLGFTLESALERPLRGPFYYLVGLGGAYLERGPSASGEGVARLGLSRRLAGNGWYARLEVRVPFDVGLDDSGLNRQLVALDIGNRFHWRDVSELNSAFGASRRGTARVEGTVLLDGKGQGGVPILVNGRPRGTSRRDGSFSIGGVPAGNVSVSLDLRPFEPGYEVAGISVREFHAVAGGSYQADFSIGRFSSLQAALVMCEGSTMVPVGGARLLLAAGSFLRSAVTSNIGGFQFDRIPPGIYELQLDRSMPGDLPALDNLPVYQVDLTRDIFGEVIRLRCPEANDAGSPIRLLPAPDHR